MSSLLRSPRTPIERVAPIAVEVVEHPARLPAVAEAWEALSPPEHPGAVFRSAAWLVPWWNAFSNGAALRIFLARRGGRLVGALPAMRAKGPLGLRVLRLLGDNVVASDYLGLIADPLEAEAAARAIAERILDEEQDVILGGLLPDEVLLAALREAARAEDLAVRASVIGPAPYLDLQTAGGDFDAWLTRLPQGAGPQLRRRRRWLERCRGFAVEVATAEADVAIAIEELLRLHQARWAPSGGSAGVPDETVRDFHRQAARALARRGQARVYLLRVEGAVRAAFYGFEHTGRFAFYQSGSDPSWRQRSVGTVVLGAALEDAFRRGLVEFDFLRGDEAYKRIFASGRRELLRAAISPMMRARLVRVLEAKGRSAARWLLPTEARAFVADRLARRRRRPRSGQGARRRTADTGGAHG